MLEQLLDNPVIAAVKNSSGLEVALNSPCNVIFILYGDICHIGEAVQRIKQSGKLAIVHINLIDGLSNRDISVYFLKNNTAADGIISTKMQLIKYAKQLGLITVQRFFLWDSMSLENVRKYITNGTADFIEILPGIMPKIVERCVADANIPIITGGLISDKADIMSALGAGATAISTTKEDLWFES